jgi:hypothetical protein
VRCATEYESVKWSQKISPACASTDRFVSYWPFTPRNLNIHVNSRRKYASAHGQCRLGRKLAAG